MTAEGHVGVSSSRPPGTDTGVVGNPHDGRPTLAAYRADTALATVISSERLSTVGESVMNSRNFDDIDRMFEQMTRAMGDLQSRVGSGIDAAGLGDAGAHTRLTETEDGYRLLADVPGFEVADIDLTVADGVLALSAVRETTEGAALRSRRVDERVTLPADADAESASASYKNGVLDVVIPFAADRDTGHRIDIE
jgi:HSP20 family molecular chaperone IbpA